MYASSMGERRHFPILCTVDFRSVRVIIQAVPIFLIFLIFIACIIIIIIQFIYVQNLTVQRPITILYNIYNNNSNNNNNNNNNNNSIEFIYVQNLTVQRPILIIIIINKY
jgi:hypothetical protein